MSFNGHGYDKKAFNPDQERDELGRFAAGDGSGAAELKNLTAYHSKITIEMHRSHRDQIGNAVSTLRDKDDNVEFDSTDKLTGSTSTLTLQPSGTLMVTRHGPQENVRPRGSRR